MPGRNGYSTQGGWAEGGSNASGVPGSLTLDGRVDNQPPEYVASEQIEFVNGFTSGDGDSFDAYITDGSSGSSNSGAGNYASGGYRYGFNGKENDNEVKGEGKQQDYGMRIYDPRLGKFLSVDPLTKLYPWISPYIYAENEPISNIDLDGLEKVKATVNPVAAGVQQYTDEKKEQAQGLLKYVTSFEPYRDLWGYAKDWGKAVTGEREAVHRVNEKTTKAITNTSMAVANGISKPAIFLSTMHTRSANENIQGLSFYGLKGLELYGLIKLPEVLESRLPGRNLKVDLMGGPKSTLGEGWINFDMNAIEGIKADVRNFKEYFHRNTISEMVVNNPRADFLEQVKDAIQQGGTIKIRGTMSNKYFNKIYNGKAGGLDDFLIQETNSSVPNLGYKTSEGEPIKGEIKEITLTKK